MIGPGQSLTFRRRRRQREARLPLDHLVQGALQPLDRHRLSDRRRRRCSSSRGRSARRCRPPPGRSSGRRPTTSARAPTPTSAGSTRSCGAPSGSSSSARPHALPGSMRVSDESEKPSGGRRPRQSRCARSSRPPSARPRRQLRRGAAGGSTGWLGARTRSSASSSGLARVVRDAITALKRDLEEPARRGRARAPRAASGTEAGRLRTRSRLRRPSR